MSENTDERFDDTDDADDTEGRMMVFGRGGENHDEADSNEGTVGAPSITGALDIDPTTQS